MRLQLTEQQTIQVIGKAMVIVDITRLCVLIFDETIGRAIDATFSVVQKLSRAEAWFERRREVTDYRVSMAAYAKQCQAYDRATARRVCKSHHPAGKGLWDEEIQAK